MIIGIDLGTSTSEVAYVDESGRVIVIPNSENEVVTPSVVHIERSGQVIVGNKAREYLFTRPECTFMEVKRKFGLEEKLSAHGKDYLPEDIQSHIIGYLVECAKEYVGKDVTGVVITVPAYFTDIQRKQTIRAGTLAGVEVKRVINEPTAAALDYGLKNMNECEYILVYDFGGGTLDVTVLELFEGVINVKSSCGNNRLGGKDFDEILMKRIGGAHYEALMEDPRACMKLRQAATDCKTALSKENSTQVRIPLITAGISIDCTITRDGFEKLIRPLVDSTGTQIDTALDDAGLSASDLQRVILVGGSTRVPLIREFVKEKLGNISGTTANSDFDNADCDYSPELMVVRGAAIQAAIIDDVIEQEQSVVLADICPFTLGVRVVTEDGFMVDPLIQRNVSIPYEYSKVYSAITEYQKGVHVEIYQGESKSPYENTRIGLMDFDKLPQRQDELAKIEVTFSYDVNGLLGVKTRAIGNNKTATTVIDINNNDLPVKPPVKLSEWKNASSASKYRPLLRKAEKILDMTIGSRAFVEFGFFEVHDLCEGLKADILLGDLEEAEVKAEEIKSFIDNFNGIEQKFKEFDL